MSKVVHEVPGRGDYAAAIICGSVPLDIGYGFQRSLVLNRVHTIRMFVLNRVFNPLTSSRPS